MNAQAFINKVSWVRRRARRIQAFFCETRSNAVSAAALDWMDFNPLAPSRALRICAQLGICRNTSHSCQTGTCHNALMGLFQPIPQPVPSPRLKPLQPLPSLAPGVIDGPYYPRPVRERWVLVVFWLAALGGGVALWQAALTYLF